MPGQLLTIAETTLFIRQAAEIWSDAERAAFIEHIAASPEDGDIIPGTGGVRKLRWRRQGFGKRGGVRVIYFYHDDGMPIYLLMVYAKAQQGDLNPEEKRRVSDLVAALKKFYGR